MTFEEYAAKARTTVVYPNKDANLVYPVLGLTSEAGEVADKLKKLIRDHNGQITDAFRVELSQELGDVLWYVAAVAAELKVPLEEVAAGNIEKLFSRKDRAKLHGTGDNR